MINYVAGLLFNDSGEKVALVLKNRPSWQAGNYNAVGGKVEEGETVLEAMIREFYEEAGVVADWKHSFALQGADFQVNFFRCFDSKALDQVITITDELIEVLDTSDLPGNLIPNLQWIVPLLRDKTVEIVGPMLQN
jgi:8-oxo-dGTP diphosphatase